MQTTSVQFDKDTRALIDRIGEEKGSPMSQVIREAIAYYYQNKTILGLEAQINEFVGEVAQIFKDKSLEEITKIVDPPITSFRFGRYAEADHAIGIMVEKLEKERSIKLARKGLSIMAKIRLMVIRPI